MNRIPGCWEPPQGRWRLSKRQPSKHARCSTSARRSSRLPRPRGPQHPRRRPRSPRGKPRPRPPPACPRQEQPGAPPAPTRLFHSQRPHPLALRNRAPLNPDILLSIPPARPGPDPVKLDACIAWLAAQLQSGPLPRTQLAELGAAAGYSLRTLSRAKNALGLRSIPDPASTSLWAMANLSS